MTPRPLAEVRRGGVAGPDCLEMVHEMLAELWTGAPDVDDADRMMFEIAVVEIAGNVVEHARPRPVRCELHLTVHDDALEATFCDSGQEADVDLADTGLPDPLAETGRGLAMVRATVDVLEHARVADSNRWYLRRTRTR